MADPDKNIMQIESAENSIDSAIHAILDVYTDQTQSHATVLKAQINHQLREVKLEVISALKQSLGYGD